MLDWIRPTLEVAVGSTIPPAEDDRDAAAESIAPFRSLDFVYVPTADVDAAIDRYLEGLGAELVWFVRAMGTTVAAVRLAGEGPLLLLSGHLAGPTPILVYRVDDHAATVARLRASDVSVLEELEIPHGPVTVVALPDGQRLAVYELTRPEAATHFDGRDDRAADGPVSDPPP